METLNRAYSQVGPARLYWCGREGEDILDSVQKLLLTARSHGREAYYVPTFGFDDLLLRLSMHCLSGNLLQRARQLYEANSKQTEQDSPPFAVESHNVTRLIKSNAFSVECPSELFQFRVPCLNGQGAWKLLREMISGTGIAAGLLRQNVVALGTLDEIKQVFDGKVEGEIARTPITNRELAITDGVILHILTQGILRGLAQRSGLEADERKNLIWDRKEPITERVNGTDCLVYEAATLFLRRYGGKQYLIIKPTIHGTSKAGTSLPGETIKELKRRKLTGQYNRQFNEATNAWRKKLFASSPIVLEFPPNSGSAFRFNISCSPAFAGISTVGAEKSLKISEPVRQMVLHKGLEINEPMLIFSNKQADGAVKDPNPIRGIVRNRPYDYVLTRQGLQEIVRVGVICSARDAGRMAEFLSHLQYRQSPDSKQEYLLEYPGFAQAFGLPVDLPLPEGTAWEVCPELDSGRDLRNGSAILFQNLKACINSMRSRSSPHVIMIYVPERWRKWECYAHYGERFDLHDFVKAYCVQHGIATQFLRESTFCKPHQCEILWWLALSLYVKAMRTPWVLEGIDTSTAFMGLGYSLDPVAVRGRHVVLGSSHIYNSEGVGLRYRLSKIEDPIWRKKNPYMSREDARRAGEGVRQLFYESMSKLPGRVAIHKMTPFLPEEKIGLLEGLAGIEAVDMIEVHMDPALRYVSSTFRNNAFQAESYPVKRGTVVALDNRRALLWTHGTVQGTTPGRSYYLGKSRIPAPLILTRHYGCSSLNLLASEILGLSKMDWNTFDMYTKLLATIQSSAEIARIGTLLDRFRPASYDYRLFI